MIFSKEALLNYFAEFLGIIVTIILIPLILYFYTKRKNRIKYYIGTNLLLDIINKQLDKLVPEHCKDFDKGYIFDREILNGIVEFEIKNETDVESYIFKLLSNKRISLKKTKEVADDYWDKINSVRTALFDILQTYEDVISYKIIKSYYKLDYNIKTQERLKEKEEFEIVVIAETIEIVIRLLFEMRDNIVKNKSKILLSEFRMKFGQS